MQRLSVSSGLSLTELKRLWVDHVWFDGKPREEIFVPGPEWSETGRTVFLGRQGRSVIQEAINRRVAHGLLLLPTDALFPGSTEGPQEPPSLDNSEVQPASRQQSPASSGPSFVPLPTGH